MGLLKILRFIALGAFAVLAASAWAEERQNEIVPELNAFLKLSERSRLFLLGDQTRNTTAGSAEGEVGVHLDYTLKPIFRPELHKADWERMRYMWMRVGYVNLSTPDKRSSGPTERRGIIELTGRAVLPQAVWLSNRFRVDLRGIDGEFSQRYRYRFMIEKELTVSGTVMVPYALAEIYYDTRYDTLNRQLYQVGAEIELSEHWRVEPYLARQNDSSSASGNVDRVGLVLKYFH